MTNICITRIDNTVEMNIYASGGGIYGNMGRKWGNKIITLGLGYYRVTGITWNKK